jgi:hypothetical protein
MKVDFSNPELPVISIAIPISMLDAIIADPIEGGYLQVSKEKITEAAQAAGYIARPKRPSLFSLLRAWLHI